MGRLTNNINYKEKKSQQHLFIAFLSFQRLSDEWVIINYRRSHRLNPIQANKVGSLVTDSAREEQSSDFYSTDQRNLIKLSIHSNPINPITSR